jgi:lysozyme family protein
MDAAFEAAVDHAMRFEVGGHWDVNHPAVELGLIETRDDRLAVGYVNDLNDAGGETKFGIAANLNPDLDITNLTWEQAKGVYYERYWLEGRCHELPPRVAVLHFDGCINHGVKRAGVFLQRAAGVTPDGVIGKLTLQRVNSLDDRTLCERICDQRAQFYRTIVANRPSQAKFLRGWLRRIDEMRAFALNLEL